MIAHNFKSHNYIQKGRGHARAWRMRSSNKVSTKPSIKHANMTTPSNDVSTLCAASLKPNVKKSTAHIVLPFPFLSLFFSVFLPSFLQRVWCENFCLVTCIVKVFQRFFFQRILPPIACPPGFPPLIPQPLTLRVQNSNEKRFDLLFPNIINTTCMLQDGEYAEREGCQRRQEKLLQNGRPATQIHTI